MSDFDKEAEREKLREKYEADKQKREATEQMSELLLKGATMTNSHCGTCGDPIFRYEGQEFCPTCEEVVAERAADEGQAAGDAAQPPAADETEQATTTDETEQRQGPSGDRTRATEETGPSPATEETPGTRRDPEPAENGAEDVTAGADPSAGTSPPEATPSGETTTPDAAAQSGGQPASTGAESSVSGGKDDQTAAVTTTDTTASGAETSAPQMGQRDSLATARASLTRTVTQLAQQAETAEDLERARAYLAATEEAADALAAVKQADR